MSKKLFVLLLFASSVFANYQKWHMQSSWFLKAIKNNHMIELTLSLYNLTLFLPENQAVDDYGYGDIPNDLAHYHLAHGVNTLEMLNSSMKLKSASFRNPPLWITKTSSKIFVNNAKIIKDRSNLVGETKKGMHQVLHVIDRVLDPMPRATASELLQSYREWSVQGESVSKFRDKVLEHDQKKQYDSRGGHTFFIPVDKKMTDYKLRNIDSHIILGHIVHDHVAFLRPTPKDFMMQSASHEDHINISLSIHEDKGKYSVKSYTVGDSEHRRGRTTAEILVPNIPVANGVVHLISQPLAIYHRELRHFPYLPTLYKISADPTLNRTHHLGQKAGLHEHLESNSAVFTYFAPRDRGWGKYLNEDDLDGIMGRHLVTSTTRYTMEKLYELSQGNGTILNTVSDAKLKLEVIKNLNDYHIKWQGKMIRVYRPDYVCSDGIVHVIDEPFAEDLISEEEPKQEGIIMELETTAMPE